MPQAWRRYPHGRVVVPARMADGLGPYVEVNAPREVLGFHEAWEKCTIGTPGAAVACPMCCVTGRPAGIDAGVTGRRFVRLVAVAWRRLRRRMGWLDHLIRAGLRYDEADGGRLAAAVTYYAFFATFALGLLAFAAFGFILDDPAVLRSVER